MNEQLDTPNIDINEQSYDILEAFSCDINNLSPAEAMKYGQEAIKRLINSIVLEVIGEDEEYHRNYTISRVMETRNKLKAEQRQSLKEKLNVN